MAKKKVQPKKTPAAKKGKKVSTRKAEPKKKAKAMPKKKVNVVLTKKAKSVSKAAPQKKATARKASKNAIPTTKKTRKLNASMMGGLATGFEDALPANQLRTALRALSPTQLRGYFESHDYHAGSEEAGHDLIEEYIMDLKSEGREQVEDDEYGECDGPDGPIEEALEEVKQFTSEAAQLRQRVADLLNKLDDRTLQWLHFEMTDPDAEGEITADEEAEEARDNFPPLNRPALVQELTTMAVDEFQLADDPDLAETLRDEDSIRGFLTSNKP